jgi:hypothetical protein
MGANLALARRGKKMAAAVVQLDGSVLNGLLCLCLYGVRTKNEQRS